ncbi:UNVERIFIED_CONTAM: Retrovirus-related Pol polyprotein from transposon RE1 [Sesamum angustifolium]|uniref:Retrovirus-related Pol polyprotein from transposon RE1 n=1 Tax=Sesamum angustifolium TaxID=2727405 RepID=A0AAW2JHR7_9LAMI
MDTAALQVRAPGKKDYLAKGGNQRRTYVDKRGQYCTNCDKSGHTKDTCFKLHGTPDWYKELIEKKRREGGPMRGYNAEATETHNVQHQGTDNLLQELIRLMKGEGGQGKQIQNDPLHGNFAQMDDFAGYKVWDIDTNTVLHSRDVIFHEDVFPYESPPTPSVSLPLVQPTDDDDSACIPSTFSPAHISFVALLSSLQEPRTYYQASKDDKWVEAMNQELTALEKNDTWDLVELPPGKKAIGSRWVLKLKLNPDESIADHREHLIICSLKGYNQIEGIDYFDSFSPVAKSVTVRVFMALAVAKGWPLLQLDVNNAFLHGHLDEEVYMLPPEGYMIQTPGQVCKLKRSLYGLKQASRQWNIELTVKLQEFGFVQCPHDHCLFLKITSTCFVALLVYVDDILLSGNSKTEIAAIKSHLDTLFTIKDLGHAKYFLGLELARSAHGLLVTQQKYLTDILRDVHMLDSRPAPTPLPPGLKLSADDGTLLFDPGPFRRLVGRLLYLGFTRPDISFATQQLSQFLHHPRSSHWDAALHVLRYQGNFVSRIVLLCTKFSSAHRLH